MEVTHLGPHALVVTTQPFSANSLVVRTPDGPIILVDTPTTPADTAALLDWLETYWHAPPTYAINSHWHADAAGGNQVLRARGVTVISSELTATRLARDGVHMRDDLVAMFTDRDPDTAAELAELRPTPANRVIDLDDQAPLTLGGEPVQLIYPGPSHSADSIAIYFPHRRLLYGGCTVRSDGQIINRREAAADNWPQALEQLAALEPAVVVPGHGRRFDPAMIDESITAARALGDGVDAGD